MTKRKPGPEPERLKITLPPAEALRRLVNAPPATTKVSRYSKRKARSPRKTA